MKKFKFQHPTDKVLIFVLVLIIGLLTAILWDFGQKLDILWKQDQNTPAMNLDVKVYIQSALKGLYASPTVTDPLQSRVYMPEAQIYLPLSDLSRNLMYNYQAADKALNSPAQAIINTGQNINHLANSFADVPCLQRMVSFTINQKGDNINNGHLAGSVTLKDSRILYLYDNNSPGCDKFWFPGRGASDIVALLKQAQSY